MKKPSKIAFDMEEIDEADFSVIEVQQDFYTRPTSKLRGSLRFSIPKPIVFELGLQASDDCYFIQQETSLCLAFKIKPEGISEHLVKHRKLAKVGKYDTLYVCLPPIIRHQYKFPITAIQLLHPKGYQNHEWIIKPITIDSI